MDQGVQKGLVHISDHVVSAIIRYVVTGTPGIAGMSGSSVTQSLAKRLGGKTGSKGMSVEVTEADVAIDLQVIINYGFRIQDVCCTLQQNVRSAVESMLGLSLSVVNIRVEKLAFPQQ